MILKAHPNSEFTGFQVSHSPVAARFSAHGKLFGLTRINPPAFTITVMHHSVTKHLALPPSQHKMEWNLFPTWQPWAEPTDIPRPPVSSFCPSTSPSPQHIAVSLRHFVLPGLPLPWPLPCICVILPSLCNQRRLANVAVVENSP